MTKIGILFLLVLLCLNCFSQKEFHFNHLNTDNGLSNNNCTAIVQDQNGFIWIGTANGLNRYDGISFKIFRHDDKDTNSLSNNNIRALAIDQKGRIWIGTGKGLNCYDPVTDTFLRFYRESANSKSLSSNRISALLCSKSNMLWVGTDIGLNRFSPENHDNDRITTSLFSRTNAFATDINSITEDANGSIWIGMWWGGLKKINPNTFVVKSYFSETANRDGLSNDNVLGVYCDKENNIWASNYLGGLSCFSIGKDTFLKKPGIPGNSDPGVIEEDLTGRLWIKNTPGSLLIYEPETRLNTLLLNEPGNPSCITSGYIADIFCDKSGMVWLATDKGVSYYNPHGELFSRYLHRLNIGKRAYCNSFFEANDQLLWIAVYDVGVVRFDPKTGEAKVFTDEPGNPNSINHKTVNGIAADASGNIWLATNNGICVIDHLTGSVINRLFYSRENDPAILNGISARTTCWQSRFFWGVEGGIFDVENQKKWLLSEDGRISINQLKINCISGDRKGNLWIGTEFLGLKHFETSTGQIGDFVNIPGDSTSICSNTIDDIFESKNGTLWISTPNGLSRFDAEKGKFRNYSQQQGLSASDCFSAREDANGNIWILTSSGLDKYDPNTGSFTNYDASDGLSFNQKGLYQSKSGCIYGGHSEDGFYCFYPDNIPKISGNTSVVFTDFFVFNEPVRVSSVQKKSPLTQAIQYTREIVLEHNQNVFGFEFSSLNFSNSGKSRYSCKLEGFDDHWFVVDRKNRRVSYTNLNPGSYVFRVKRQ
jgi:ligand-binding sensor domain-containing protein